MRGDPPFGRDRRGASEVLGAILMFAILIAALGLFQVTIVPQTNEEVEFKHSTQVRADMTDLRAAMVSSAADGGRRTVSIETGTNYPTRSLTINPPDPRGRLSTSGDVTGAVELQNVAATDPEAGDFWDGTASFDSRFVSYRPSYSYYGGAPVTRYEPTVVYSSFADADVVETPQSLVDGRTLGVVLVSGSLSRSGAATESVDVVPISTSTESVTVTDPGPLRVRTHLSESAWQDVLGTEPHASVADYTTNADAPNVVEISLATGEWELQVSKVGMNAGGTQSAAYVVPVDGTDRNVDAGEHVDYTVQVLDEYGNPVPGVTVDRDSGASLTTDADGRVSFETVVAENTTEAVWFGSKPADGSSPRRVDFDLDVSRDVSGQLINPSNGLVLRRVEFNTDGDDFDAAFENRASGSLEVTGLRFTFYNPDTQSNKAVEVPTYLVTNQTTSRAAMGGEFVPTGGVTVPSGGKFAVKLATENSDGSDYAIDEADFLVVTMEFSDRSSRVYFVGSAYDIP